MEGLTALWAYEGIARSLISGAKYKYFWDFLRELTSFSVGQLHCRVELAYLWEFLEGKPVIVPVPLWPARERARGFNQAKIVAQFIGSTVYQLEVKDILVRVRDTGRQVGKTREERLNNMTNAFAVNPKFQLPKQVLLVDDVWTTGATMNECARVLRQGGGQKVWGLVLAR